jgi:hypothetical protein
MRSRLFLGLLLATPCTLSAQSKPSEKAIVTQVVNGTTITIEYDRPVARGRDSLFGKVVHWGETWTPGANWATTLEVDKDVRLDGHFVPKGKYSVWMVTAENDLWTFFLNKNPRIWHTRRPRGTDDDVVRFKVQPEQLFEMEALMWYFPRIEKAAAVLRMHWGTTAVSMRIDTAGVID